MLALERSGLDAFFFVFRFWCCVVFVPSPVPPGAGRAGPGRAVPARVRVNIIPACSHRHHRWWFASAFAYVFPVYRARRVALPRRSWVRLHLGSD